MNKFFDIIDGLLPLIIVIIFAVMIYLSHK